MGDGWVGGGGAHAAALTFRRVSGPHGHMSGNNTEVDGADFTVLPGAKVQFWVPVNLGSEVASRQRCRQFPSSSNELQVTVVLVFTLVLPSLPSFCMQRWAILPPVNYVSLYLPFGIRTVLHSRMVSYGSPSII